MATPNLSEIVATSLYNRSKMAADNVTKNNAILAKMSMSGKIKTVSGGRGIVQELTYAENQSFKRYSGYELLDIRPSQVISAAVYSLKQYAVAVTISGLEELENAGKEKMIDLISTRNSNAQNTMSNNISIDLYSDGTANGGKQITGLEAQIASSPNTGTVGGINRANWSFWRNKTASKAGISTDDVKEEMAKMWLTLLRGKDMPDLIMAGDSMYRKYWLSLQDQERYTNTEMAKMGFENIAFRGSCPVVPDGGQGGGCPTESMYFLNCKYIHYRPHKDRNIVPLMKRSPVNQDATVVHLVWAGNLTMSNASLQGVLRST